MNRRDAETQSFKEITEKVIGACIEIHRQPGPALMKSGYADVINIFTGFSASPRLHGEKKDFRL